MKLVVLAMAILLVWTNVQKNYRVEVQQLVYYIQSQVLGEDTSILETYFTRLATFNFPESISRQWDTQCKKFWKGALDIDVSMHDRKFELKEVFSGRKPRLIKGTPVCSWLTFGYVGLFWFGIAMYLCYWIDGVVCFGCFRLCWSMCIECLFVIGCIG